ncbi:DUF6461 domain-containing protein [Streptomyces sp. 150FB]|uniref:DUF6461 domain-containing protein n=1 Tax=Streptomyces sp. 150FB TaxID=1576605 RepID=UPI001F2F36A0|nr:DUF6461 domain-containing protein [Streptomyces sp. 150FB]
MKSNSPWSWIDSNRYPSFCLSFTRNITPTRVLEIYGATPGVISKLSEEESVNVRPKASEMSTLRAGSIAEWSFCFETFGLIGVTPKILKKLSEGREAIVIFSGGDGMDTLDRCVDSTRCESFDLLTSRPAYGEGPFLIKSAMDKHRSANPGDLMLPAVFNFITCHYGLVIDEITARGKLATAYVPPLPLDQSGNWPPSTNKKPAERGLGASLHLDPPPE